MINSSRPSASVFPPPHLIITRNAHGAEEGEGLGTRLLSKAIATGVLHKLIIIINFSVLKNTLRVQLLGVVNLITSGELMVILLMPF